MVELPWFHIQRAALADVDALAALAIANISEQERHWPSGAAAPTASDAQKAITDALFGPRPAASAYVAVERNAAIGYAFVSELFPGAGLRRAWFLKELFVDTEKRSRGVGSALMAHVSHAACAAGADRLEFHVHPGNDGARRLYDRLGFGAPERLVYRRDFSDARGEVVE